MFKFKMILQKRIFGKRYDDSSKKKSTFLVYTWIELKFQSKTCCIICVVS